MQNSIGISISIRLFAGTSASQSGILVHNHSEIVNAVKAAKAGARIVLVKGICQDVELMFQAESTEDAPIPLSLQEKGKVSLGEKRIKR